MCVHILYNLSLAFLLLFFSINKRSVTLKGKTLEIVLLGKRREGGEEAKQSQKADAREDSYCLSCSSRHCAAGLFFRI